MKPRFLKTARRILPMLLITLFAFQFTPALQAQDEPAAEAATEETAVEPPAEGIKLSELIQQGGLAMWPLGLLSVAMVTLVIMNGMAIRKEKLIPSLLVPQVGHKIADHEFQDAMDACNTFPCMFSTVIGAGLERVGGDELDIDNVKTAMDDAETEEMVGYMGQISYLSIIGAIAPMIGLLGTVSGMIKAFNAISQGGMGNADVLAANIGEALVTTATGLIVAIPSMLFYFYFKNKFMKIVASMGRVSGQMIDAAQNGQLVGYGEPAPSDDYATEESDEVEED